MASIIREKTSMERDFLSNIAARGFSAADVAQLCMTERLKEKHDPVTTLAMKPGMIHDSLCFLDPQTLTTDTETTAVDVFYRARQGTPCHLRRSIENGRISGIEQNSEADVPAAGTLTFTQSNQWESKFFPIICAQDDFLEPGLTIAVEQDPVILSSGFNPIRTLSHDFAGSLRHFGASYGASTNLNSGELTLFYKGRNTVYKNVTSEKFQHMMHAAADVECVPDNLMCSQSAGQHPLSAEMGEKKLQIDLNCSSLDTETGANVELNGSKGPNQPEATVLVGGALPLRIMQGQYQYQGKDVSARSDDILAEEQQAPIFPQALPQARKASMFRFLQGRKERLKSALTRTSYCLEKA